MALRLTVSDLDAGYGAVRALQGVSLDVADGETVAILGTNGNGKSTLMKCVMGLVRPTRGRVTLELDGVTHDLTRLEPEMIVDLGIAMVPEGRRLFPKLTVEPSKTVKGVVVTVQVEEGEPYVLDKIEVRGTSLPPEDIQEQGQFKTGEVVSFSDIGRELIRVMDQLKQEGYMKASYKALRQLNDEKKTVAVFVDVDPGPQYRFGSLIIKGLDLESEPTMRKLWAMKPGDPFKGLYPDTYLKQIRDRGILDNLGDTKAEIAPNDKTLLVTVTLIFKGGPDPDAEYRKRQKQIQ